ncbi:hypothetical protein D7X25_20225 [bacterium 1XD42-8]|jgi:hypothetical protein|nr:hypothetical protein D7X25_20225 [bacterium 1XD42-8]
MDVYGGNANIIPENILELPPYFEEAMPNKFGNNDFESYMEGIMMDMKGYLPKKERKTKESLNGICIYIKEQVG